MEVECQRRDITKRGPFSYVQHAVIHIVSFIVPRGWMMINETKTNSFIISCDQCGQELDFNGTFQQMVSHVKDNDWSIKKIDGEWTHTCPDCQEGI